MMMRMARMKIRMIMRMIGMKIRMMITTQDIDCRWENYDLMFRMMLMKIKMLMMMNITI